MWTAHLRSLMRFTGRETRQPFWLWVLSVVGAAMAGWTGFMAIYIGEHMAGPVEATPPNFAAVPIVMGVMSLAVILLLAAAVARRLHDSGRTGWWALPTPILLLSGTAMMAHMFATVQAEMQRGDSGAGPPPFFEAIMLNNVVYLLSLVVLIVLCCMPCDPGDNRYGSSGTGEA